MFQFTTVSSLLASTICLTFLLSTSASPVHVPSQFDLIARTNSRGTTALRDDALIKQCHPITYFYADFDEAAKTITFKTKNLQSSEKPEDADLEHLFELRTAVEAFGNKIVVEAVTDNTDAKKKVKTDLHAKVKKVLNESPNLYYLNHWANNAKTAQTGSKDAKKPIADTKHRGAFEKLLACAYAKHFKTEYNQVATALDTLGSFKKCTDLGKAFYEKIDTDDKAAREALKDWKITDLA